MTIEQLDQIDAITEFDNGAIILHIIDNGLIENTAEHDALLLAKVRLYQDFVASPQFQEDFPGVTLSHVAIRVDYQLSLTDALRVVKIPGKSGTRLSRLPDEPSPFTIEQN